VNLSFYGAAREVTGSCYCLEANGKKLIIDCGLQQGQDEKDDQSLPFSARDINYVVLTHAHIDHSGRLPLLVKEGFNGSIYATKITCDLISIMLMDSAKIQEMDAKWKNKRDRRAGKKESIPLYTVADAENTLKYLVPCSYGNMVSVSDSIKVNFVDAGHILGSASAEIFLNEGSYTKKIVFSGDIGNINQPIIKDPQCIKQADYVVMEATYGDRNHVKDQDYTLTLAKIIDETLSGGGNVVIPSFAVARTQELLYFIREIKERKLVAGVPDFPVYVDSPLASAITKIFDSDLSGYADEQASSVIKSGTDALSFPNLFFTDSTEDSKAINSNPVPKVIISSSGMCEAGRIRHHLKHNLWKKECSIVFVGFQAVGTLGRALLDGAKKVSILDEGISVLAAIYNFTGLSAHADRDGLLKWINCFEKKPDKVFITHGEDSVCDEFVKLLNDLGFAAVAPAYEAEYDLSSGELIASGFGNDKKVVPGQKGKTLSPAYVNLLHASELLSQAISNNEGAADKDLGKFAEEIVTLAKNWER
jgi:metallo-beta-lactamase family protein